MNSRITSLIGMTALVGLCLPHAGCEKAIEANKTRKDFSDRSYVRNNLAQLSEAGRVFTFDHKVDVVRYDDLVGRDLFIRKITPVDGEDYRPFDYSPNTNIWTIVTKSGLSVTFERPVNTNQSKEPTSTAGAPPR